MRFHNVFRPHDSTTLLDSDSKPLRYYCQECDSSENIVESGKPETGSFFIQHGHRWHAERGYHGKDERPLFPNHCFAGGEYEAVVFAICQRCMKATGFDKLIANNDSTED